jgi:ABC-type uncharacterized transport system involved in gliding motility auxiliary subunit
MTMRVPLSHRWQLRLFGAGFLVLLLVLIGLLQWLSREYRLEFDWTQARRHSLSDASLAVLAGFKEPITVTAYASQRGKVRRAISDFVARYQAHKSDLRLEFIDPDLEPEKARAAGVQFDGELILRYGEARENLPPNRLNEEQFTHALTRLGHRGERWLVFLSGHGEGSPDTQRNFDYSVWAGELRKRGFKTRVLALGTNPQIPANTSALIIAGPQSRFLPGEIKELARYLKDGGNLLWLQNPGSLHGLEPLAEGLTVEFLPGTVVDPTSAALTGNATAIVIDQYRPHALVRNFVLQTVFPHAAGIALPGANAGRDDVRPADSDRWKAEVLFDTRASSWSETGKLDGAVRFDKGADIKGPLNLGVALTRATGGAEPRPREQRAVVIGDADFLTNSYLGNVGNLELGMSLVNWLSQDEAFVNIPVRTAKDRSLSLGRNTQLALGLVFLALLPLVMVASGVTIWWRRRKR